MNEILSTWDLIEQSKFDDACTRADQEYKESGSLLPLRNKVIAYMKRDLYPDAVTMCRTLIELDRSESEYDYKFLGTCYWLLNDRGNAIETWKKGLSCKYTDAAGGVELPGLLFYAGTMLENVELQKEAISLLRKRWIIKKMGTWPTPIAGFLLEKINAEQLLETISENEALKAKQLCQAHFYIGLLALKYGDENGYFKHLNYSREFGTPSYQKQEYYLAAMP